jgi:hypothetical protein
VHGRTTEKDDNRESQVMFSESDDRY